jgi:hemerythrin
MALLPWSDEYSVGVSTFDSQHKQLFQFINDLHAAMAAGKANDILGKTLSGLIEYTKSHFGAEERLMELHKYPHYLQHKSEHQVLITTVEAFQTKFQQGNSYFTIELMNTLKNWLTNHILKTDMKYTEFFANKGVR